MLADLPFAWKSVSVTIEPTNCTSTNQSLHFGQHEEFSSQGPSCA